MTFLLRPGHLAAVGCVLTMAAGAACNAPPGSPTAPSATVSDRKAAGNEGGEGIDGGVDIVACDDGRLAATDNVGEVAPVSRGVVRTGYVIVDIGTLIQRARAGEPLVFNVFPDACVTAQPVGVQDLGPDALVWTGYPIDAPDGTPVTVVVNGDAVEATMRATSETFYRITPVGGGVHAVLQVSPAAFPPD
jgi:hypothetical protein